MNHQNNFDMFTAFLAVLIALNTVMIVHNIVSENNEMIIVNFLTGIFLIIGHENRRSRTNDE